MDDIPSFLTDPQASQLWRVRGFRFAEHWRHEAWGPGLLDCSKSSHAMKFWTLEALKNP